MAERIRAGEAGIPALFTRTGVGTDIAQGKQLRHFDGSAYIMEVALFADLAIVHAHRGDVEGNLTYRITARNFNPIMAPAARVTVAEVEQIVAAGELDSDQMITPGIFVNRLVKESSPRKFIEQCTTRVQKEIT